MALLEMCDPLVVRGNHGLARSLASVHSFMIQPSIARQAFVLPVLVASMAFAASLRVGRYLWVTYQVMCTCSIHNLTLEHALVGQSEPWGVAGGSLCHWVVHAQAC
jgi:hypothetical protein